MSFPTVILDRKSKHVHMNTMMSMRPKLAKPGMAGWVTHVPSYLLPVGLKNGAPVTVQSRQDLKVRVRDANGRDWIVASVQVDCGFEFQMHGRWLDEAHPEVTAYLQKSAGDLAAETDVDAVIDWPKVSDVAWMQKVLTRTGHDFVNATVERICRIREDRRARANRSSRPGSGLYPYPVTLQNYRVA